MINRASLELSVPFAGSGCWVGSGGSDLQEALAKTLHSGDRSAQLHRRRGNDQLTLTCNGGSVEFDTGGGPQDLPQPFSPTLGTNLQCLQVISISVSGAAGDDTLLLGGVNTSAYTQLFDGVTVDGGTFPDSVTGPQGHDGASLAGNSGNDTIIGGTGETDPGRTQGRHAQRRRRQRHARRRRRDPRPRRRSRGGDLRGTGHGHARRHRKRDRRHRQRFDRRR